MSEIGSGDGTSYPGALDTESEIEVNSPNVNKTRARAEVINDIVAALIAIQREFGTDPAGTLTDVKTFLQTEHLTNGRHVGTVNVENYASFAAAVTAIASTETTLLINTNQTVSSAVTVPSTLHVVVQGAGKFTKSGSGTITFNGPFNAPLKQVFSGFAAGDITFGNRSRSVVYPEWWGGGIGVAAATNSTAIGSARESLSRGEVYFHAGLTDSDYYEVDGEITGKDGVSFDGAGYRSFIYRAFTSTGQQVINWDGIDNASITNLRVEGSVTSSPDNANNRRGISITQSGSPASRTKNIVIDRVWVNNCDIGVSLGGATEKAILRNSFIGPMLHDGVTGAAGGALPGGLGPRYHKILDNYIETQNTGNATGVYFGGAATGHTIGGNTIVGGKYGIQLYMDSTTEASQKRHKIVNNDIISPAKDGILVTDSNTTYVIESLTVQGNTVIDAGESGLLLRDIKYSTVSGNVIENATNHGIALTYSTTVAGNRPDHNTVTGNTIAEGGSGGAGIWIEGGSYNTVSGNAVYSVAAKGIGIFGSQTTAFNIITGNTVKDAGTYGIDENSGEDTVIMGNTIDNSTTANLRDLGTRTMIRNNKGWATENSGTGTINSGATSATITHGLSATPAAKDLFVTFTENPTSDPGNIWIDTITSTQFNVNVRSDPGASNLDFSWRAMVH